MRKRLIALLLFGLVVLVPACRNTVRGLEEDAERNANQVEQELEEEENEDDG